MKILISDFDGTFLDYNFGENIKFVQEFVKQGNIFIIATGRNITSLKKVICNYDIPFSYLIQNDGGIILDSTYQEIYRNDLGIELCKEIFVQLNSSSIFENVFYDTGYSYKKDIVNKSNRIIGKINERDRANKYLKEIKELYGNKIYAYLSNNWINITSGNNDKITAIEWLIELNNWSKNDIYTVGDSVNDLRMLTTYQGYVVGNKLNKYNIIKIEKFLELKKLL